jgi:hypothetical protein
MFFFESTKIFTIRFWAYNLTGYPNLKLFVKKPQNVKEFLTSPDKTLKELDITPPYNLIFSELDNNSI